jgi:hypothetical protein
MGGITEIATSAAGYNSIRPLVSDDYTSAGSRFGGTVEWVQIDVADAAEDVDHLISPEERLRIAMARQQATGPAVTSNGTAARRRIARSRADSNRALGRRGSAQCGFDAFEPAVELTELLRDRSLDIRGRLLTP